MHLFSRDLEFEIIVMKFYIAARTCSNIGIYKHFLRGECLQLPVLTTICDLRLVRTCTFNLAALAVNFRSLGYDDLP